MPMTIKVKPSSLGAVIGSAKTTALPIMTNTKVKVVSGYAWLSGNFVIASIQVTEARNAEKNAAITHGFKSNWIMNLILSSGPAGKVPARRACHLIRNCPQTVRNIVQKTRQYAVQLPIFGARMIVVQGLGLPTEQQNVVQVAPAMDVLFEAAFRLESG